MSLRTMEWLVRVAVVGGAVALTAAATITVSDPEGSAEATRPPARASAERDDDADSLARAVIRSNLFRVERRPAQVAYSLASAETPGMAMRAPRPSLFLRGLIRGDTARALIEGFPNETGSRLVRAGDVIAGLRVASISGGQVRVAGLDTVYVLTLRRTDP